MLSFENAPPFSAPLRFFLTAPLFAVLAGLLLVIEGPVVFASRWTPGALAATHLLTVGFMLQVMLGALIQVLPVVAGADLPRPLALARAVHVGLTGGGLLLVGGFWFGLPWALAGGLTVETVAEAVRRTGAPFVDVSSGVESAPGIKDGERMRAFVEEVRRADCHVEPDVDIGTRKAERINGLA